MYYVNPNIKDVVRIFPPQDRYGYLRLDMNENPEGLPQDFVDSVLKEFTPSFLATYPEPDIFMQKYADFVHVAPENICLTNGSDAAIRYTFEVFAAPGSSVVTVTPSFEMYGVNCNMLGLVHKPVPYSKDFTISVADIISAIDETTDIVALLNPNNPIGPNFTEAQARQVIDRANEVGAIVIFDEAYHYFCKDTFLLLINEYDNVIIFRTFSKLFSLAACRLGMVISNETIIEYLRKARPSFEVNALALKFAERILDHPAIFDELLSTFEAGKKHLIDSLEKHGYEYYPQSGNFIFIKPHIDANLLATNLMKEKILVKTYGNDLLKNYIRINIGAPKIMEQFMQALIKADTKEANQE
ncbi:pyridoxal phosphate-dependent aminotransferase [Candidatus Galacturonibacter soehngenii]|uniref:histidinol-phosphate transaminase n=1 Tax=Candidatus Galacturonatibacter soehngenii TaxID=2307010 RepID=A0A7V7QKE9_9FIRM|nr:histidinol-phosphate transaminase [Candidatus Galacturonibacter soehngenii]KAB1438277.1 histidinol-phosphate aminotransferase family protein [Candidatus Galacturonibacter soehngenii]